MDVIESMKKEMIRRKLSHRTIKTYLFYVRKFLLFCKKDPKEFSKKDIRDFLYKFMENEKAGNSINVALNSLRFMMEEVLRKNMRLGIRYSKTPKSKPTFLTKEEVKKIISVINNDKHKLIVQLMYGAGLRVSEVVKLKVNDVLLDENIGWVRKGKGNKDRPFIIPICLKEQIKILIENNKLYLFPGNKKSHLTAKSVQCIVKKATKLAGIKKNVHPHTFRHSFATHVLEEGNDVTAVQSLLGHNEPRTTLEYIHVVKPKMLSIKSPLDNL